MEGSNIEANKSMKTDNTARVSSQKTVAVNAGLRPGSGDATISEIKDNKEKSRGKTASDAFASAFALETQLGSGASGTVWKCTKRTTGEVFAAKIIDLRPFKLRERFSMARVRREVEVMQCLRHPSIIALLDAFESEDQLILVLEYAPGVELFDAILAKNRYTEDEARPIFVQVTRALQYMHGLRIVHRDVKPENVMCMDTPSRDGLFPQAKLLDFGLSKIIGDDAGSAARTFVGTPCYLAPEVEARSRGQGGAYGTEVDCWSLGAMLFVMLAARFPEFHVEKAHRAPKAGATGSGGAGAAAAASLTRAHVKMVGATWEATSEEAKDLIRGLMRFSPSQRMTATQALQHPWVTGRAWDARPPTPAEVATAAWQPFPGTGGAGGGALVVKASAFAPAVAAAATRTAGGGGDLVGPLIQEVPTPPMSSHKEWQSTGHSSAGSATGGGISDVLSVVGSPSGWSSPPPLPAAGLSGPRAGVVVEEVPTVSGGTVACTAGGWKQGGEAAGPGAAAAAALMADRNVVPTPTPPPTPVQTPVLTAVGVGAPARAAAGAKAAGEAAAVGGGRRQYLLLPPAPVRPQDTTVLAVYETGMLSNVNLAPLIHLHNSISTCLETAVDSYKAAPAAASGLRRSALLCRENLVASMKLLRKIEQTATQVLELFPDLYLAVEENEPALAHDFFSTVRSWVAELYKAVTEVQTRNNHNTHTISELMDQVARSQVSPKGGGAPPGTHRRESFTRSQSLSGDVNVDGSTRSELVDAALFEIVQRLKNGAMGGSGIGGDGGGSGGSGSAADAARAPAGAAGAAGGSGGGSSAVAGLSEEQIMDLFLALAKPGAKAGSPAAAAVAAAMTGRGARPDAPGTHAYGDPQAYGDGGSGGSGGDGGGGGDGSRSTGAAATRQSSFAAMHDAGPASPVMHPLEGISSTGTVLSDGPPEGAIGGDADDGMGVPDGGSAGAATPPAGGERQQRHGRSGGGSRETDMVRDMSVDDVTLAEAAAFAGTTTDEDGIGGGNGGGSSGSGGGGGNNIDVWPPPAAAGAPAAVPASGGAASSVASPSNGSGGSGGSGALSPVDSSVGRVRTDIEKALQLLHEVDQVLEQLALFWANTEVIFDVLLRKGDLVEKFVQYAAKPRLLMRFQERMNEYKKFWEGIKILCNQYCCGQPNCFSSQTRRCLDAALAATASSAAGGPGAHGGGSAQNGAGSGASSNMSDCEDLSRGN